jgi:hypothetical protein
MSKKHLDMSSTSQQTPEEINEWQDAMVKGKVPMSTFTFYLPTELHTKLKMLAVRRKQPMSELLVDILQEKLKNIS